MRLHLHIKSKKKKKFIRNVKPLYQWDVVVLKSKAIQLKLYGWLLALYHSMYHMMLRASCQQRVQFHEPCHVWSINVIVRCTQVDLNAGFQRVEFCVGMYTPNIVKLSYGWMSLVLIGINKYGRTLAKMTNRKIYQIFALTNIRCIE